MLEPASYLLPLYLDIVPKEAQDKVLESLVRSIVERHGGHLATGFVGTRYLLETLTRYGYGDLAYALATQTTYPSWGYMIENGATTIWELWQYATGPGMNSHNHPAFGCIDGWLYQDVAGIRPRLYAGQIEYKPHLVGDLQWAFASVKLPIGEASIRWERSENEVRYQIRVPVGVLGHIVLPIRPDTEVYEGDAKLYPHVGLQVPLEWFLGTSVNRDKSLFHAVVLPGAYEFITTSMG